MIGKLAGVVKMNLTDEPHGIGAANYLSAVIWHGTALNKAGPGAST
jgi:hypothetical protein